MRKSGSASVAPNIAHTRIIGNYDSIVIPELAYGVKLIVYSLSQLDLNKLLQLPVKLPV